MRLIHLISSNHWGGAWQYALDLCSHFLGKGWKVTALTCDAKAVDDRFRSAGVGLRHAPLRGLFDPASALILSSMLKEIPAGEGIVHVHRYRDAFTALLARRLAKRPDATHVFSEGSTETSTPTYSCRIWHTTLSGPLGNLLPHRCPTEGFTSSTIR